MKMKLKMDLRILTGIFVIGIFLICGCVEKPVAKECSLSLCDCKCHVKGQTPEELTGKICGINCLGEYGIAGCEFKEGECIEKYIAEDESKNCMEDSDCVPAQCCHPTTCINRKFAPDCSGIGCTEVCMGPIDCGAGKCMCKDNKCVVESTRKEPGN